MTTTNIHPDGVEPMRRLLFILLAWPLLFLNAATDICAGTFYGLPNGHILHSIPGNTQAINGFSTATGHTYINSHRVGIERRDGTRKEAGIASHPVYGLSRIANNWNMQATLMTLLVILMWPMGKRKFAIAGLRYLFQIKDKILKKQG
jgi:hypothetical protein